jgi:hypothetical protein
MGNYTQFSFYKDLFLRDFVLTRLENLHHSSNLRDNFRFNAIGRTRSMVTFTYCKWLAESYVTAHHQSRVGSVCVSHV